VITRDADSVSVTRIAQASPAGRVIALLKAWPTVLTATADCGVGIGVGTRAGQILHFHDETYADLLLPDPAIGRMREVLARSGRVFMMPGEDWIGLRLDTPSDASLLVTLVSVAIKANSAVPPQIPARRPTPCKARRRTALAAVTR
jgi:hypothetical protein